MRPDPRPKSDEQLLAACTLLPWERRLHHFVWSGAGCATWWVTISAPGIVFYGLIRPLDLRPALVVLMGTALMMVWVSLYFQLESAALRRRNVYWREIQRRYAGLKLKECVRDVEQQSAGGRYAAAEACVVLMGHALPSTAVWLIRVWLLSGEGGWVERRTLVPGSLQGDDAGGTLKEAGEAPISGQESEQLRRVIDEAAADATRHIPSTVFDGDPADVAVWVRGRGVVMSGDCNLAGVPPAKDSLPVVRLMRGVQGLGAKVPLSPLLVGACNAMSGQIQLGTI